MRGAGRSGGRPAQPGVILEDMRTLDELADEPRSDEQVFRASIALGIGDDDTVDIVAESEHNVVRH